MSTRRVVLAIGVFSCLAVSGYLASRTSWVRSLFVKDIEDPDELSKLAGTKLEVPSIADSNSEWPQWRGPFRDGRALASPIRTDWDKRPPTPLWSAQCGGGFSSLAAVNGKIYAQDRQGSNERVFCLNAADGKQIWAHSYPTDSAGKDPKYASGPRASPTIEGNFVYSVGGAGKFICLETTAASATPSLRWEHDLLAEFEAKMPQWGVACSPLIEGDLAIVQPGGRNGSVVAFDKATGEVRWKAGNNPSGYSSPMAATIGGQRTIFALTGNALLVIGLDGKVNDSFSWATQFDGNVATPLIVSDYIFISAAYGQGCALVRAKRTDDGVKLVQVYARHLKGMKNHHGTSIYKDRFVYGFDGESAARLKCFEFDTGNEKEGWDGSGVGKGSIILADNNLIIQTERGELCLVEATPVEFRLLAKVPKVLNGNNNWSTPALVDGKLYLRDDEKIVCYEVRQ
jgi:outer membrane protein assembly factor BamB